MIATIEKVEILNVAEEIVHMVKHSDLYERYVYTKEEVTKDEEAQQLIYDFVKMKDAYEQVQRFGKYHPDFETVSTETRKLKRKLDLHETISQYKQAEEELNRFFVQLSSEIANVVSPYIKVPTGNPYFDQLPSCGCQSGKGCGCKTKK